MTIDASAEVMVDARGMRCPWPALRLARAMREAGRVRLVAEMSSITGWYQVVSGLAMSGASL